MDLFPGFTPVRLEIDGAVINGVMGGSGPPVLLLHGYPQTHATWHKIAPALAQHHTVIATDLRGYGQSIAPPGATLVDFSKAAVAREQVAAMSALGFDRFAVVGHDRGGRVGYRMALEFPELITAFASLTVIPTIEMWDRAGHGFAMQAYHWYFLAQPEDLPERLLAADPDYFLDYTLQRSVGDLAIFDARALESYRQAFRRPTVRHAMCQDYRAAAGVDAELDAADRAAGRHLACPLLILWAQRRIATPGVETPLETWRRWADDVTGAPIACGHYMQEEVPQKVAEKLLPFLRG